MNAMKLFDQLLKSGTQAAGRYNARQSDVGKYATGAAGGSLLTMLMGSGGGRRMGGSALKMGSVAAIGMLAWKTYGEWQARQQAAAGAAGGPTPRPAVGQAPLLDRADAHQATGAHGASTAPGVRDTGDGFDTTVPSGGFAALPAPEAEAHGRAMLKAMIAAARADGHFDDRERDLVEAELAKSDADHETRRWFEDELRRPVEPSEVAAAATGPEMAAEVYLTSLLIVDKSSTMERAYLDALARELRLDDSLKAELESKAMAA